MLEFDCQNLTVPSRLLGKPVVGQDVGAFLVLAQVIEPDYRYSVQAKLLCGFDTPVASDDGSVAVDNNRAVEAERLFIRWRLRLPLKILMQPPRLSNI